MFSMLRQGTDPADVLRQMRDCNLLLQLAVVPETRRRYQFPYVTSMPIHLQTEDNPYLNSPLYETAFQGNGYEYAQASSSSSSSSLGRSRPPPPPLEPRQLNRYQNIYLQPYHAAEIVDPLIDYIQPSKWTLVSIDDHLMRTLIRAYILHEYPTFPVFHKDIFLQAMAQNDTRFCTPLLVNTLLAEACVSIPFLVFWVGQAKGERADESPALLHGHTES